jgi:hypothetical protein
VAHTDENAAEDANVMRADESLQGLAETERAVQQEDERFRARVAIVIASMALLQISIVVASVAILVTSRPLV